MLTITQEQWNAIHDDYKGEWLDYHGDKPEWIGRKVVMSTCITEDPTEKCTLLVEGVHFIILTPSDTFNYRLLSRCKQDCDYYLGYGNRQDKWLWGKNPAAHIAKMRELFEAVPVKPEWLTAEQIAGYAKSMGV